MKHEIDTKAGEKPSNLETFAAWYARSFWAHKGDFGAARRAWRAHQAKRRDVAKLVERAELARAGRGSR